MFGFIRRRKNEGSRPFSEPLDLTAASFFHDPYPVYDQLRTQTSAVAVASGGYILTRHADIMRALAEPALGNMPSRFSRLHQRNRGTSAAADVAAHILPFLDGDAHTTRRKLTSSAFGPVFKNAPSITNEAARECVEAVLGQTTLDAVHDLAAPFVQKVMCRLFGFLEADGPQLKTWAESFFFLFAPVTDPERFARVEKDLGDFRSYLAAVLDHRRVTPGDDMISALAKMTIDGVSLTDAEIIDNAILFFADGIENVQYGIGSVLLCLGTEPAILGRLHTSPDVLKAAVAEALRLETPGQIIPRVAQVDCNVAGRSLKAGTPVFLAFGSANRDPAAFDDPDVFKLDRQQGKSLSFGTGQHSCIGGQLAQMQIAAIVRELASHGVKVRTKPKQARYLHRVAHRWPQTVTISLQRIQ